MRVIGPNGEQLGIFPRENALRKAEEYDLDLVEVAPDANPPVCRVMDFAKFKYAQEKKEREAKKKQKQAQLKEIRITPRIGAHDYDIKLEHIKEFLKKGHKVRVRLFLKGREFFSHMDLGKKVIDRLITDIESVGKIERNAELLGKYIIIVFSPK
ncbi:MAG: translation initiation factor IF-3 [Candidatus Omnitrophica bacterium]|nr:translation initiation factor IF-3 [Candidatus Omnitrophota bacterium]MCM8823097.1 translation initiation factor IF-3 [Candidatus Omnitrophota bacterium]MCM8826928.1 translation initiation factor IF-3 [Candidatus Omnitrophota bacterium]